MCDVEFGIKAARERERQSRMMRNTNDRRYELETEENIKYMLSNNFMFFFFFLLWNLLFPPLAHITASPEKYDWDASKIIIFVFFCLLVECVILVVSCVIFEMHAAHSATI